MRTYELMTIFPLMEDASARGIEAVKKVLAEFGAEISKEEPFGERDLTYQIKKNTRGKFVLFTIKANPAKIVDIDRQFKLNQDLLKFLFVRQDEE